MVWLATLALLTAALWVLCRGERGRPARLPVVVAICWAVLAMTSPLGRPLVALVNRAADSTRTGTDQARQHAPQLLDEARRRGAELFESLTGQLNRPPTTRKEEQANPSDRN